MKIQVPTEINLSETQVKEIVKNYLKNKYSKKTDFEENWVKDNALWTVHYDIRGNEIYKTSKGASPAEIAASIILNTFNEK